MWFISSEYFANSVYYSYFSGKIQIDNKKGVYLVGNREWSCGTLKLNKPLDEETKKLIDGIGTTRRIIYDVDRMVADGIGTKEELGFQGEFFIEGDGFYKRSFENNFSKYIINTNSPPSTQPYFWCPWKVSEDGTELIRWNNDSGLFSHEWLSYFLMRILKPKGYELAGIVNWVDMERGEHHSIAKGKTIRKYRGFHKDVANPLEEDKAI